MPTPKFTKEQWQDPAFRERMKERDAKHSKLYQDQSELWRIKSWGIPQSTTGPKTKDERKAARKLAIKRWRAAHKLADKYLDYMKKTDQAPSNMDVTVIDERGIMPHTEMVVPESDEEKAIIALREAFLLAIGPTAIPEKIKAINTVLAYTKTKPEAQHKLRVEKAEDFLDLIAEVKKKPEEFDDDAEAD